MSNFSRIKNMLKGSTTMPVGTAQSNVHYHNGVPCTGHHDHGHEGHVHDENCNHSHDDNETKKQHVHDENCEHNH